MDFESLYCELFEKQNQYTCCYCKEQFRNSSTFLRHSKNKHKDIFQHYRDEFAKETLNIIREIHTEYQQDNNPQKMDTVAKAGEDAEALETKEKNGSG